MQFFCSRLIPCVQFLIAELDVLICFTWVCHIHNNRLNQPYFCFSQVQRYNNNVDGGTGKQVESDMEVDKQMMNPDRPTQGNNPVLCRGLCTVIQLNLCYPTLLEEQKLCWLIGRLK